MLMWSIFFVIFVAIEISSVHLISLWFATSSLVLVFLSESIKDVYVQVFIFSVLSFVQIVFLRKFVQKFIKPKEKVKADKVLLVSLEDEKEGIYYYNVKYKGSIWSAFSKDKIEEGKIVEIKEFEGNKIKI